MHSRMLAINTDASQKKKMQEINAPNSFLQTIVFVFNITYLLIIMYLYMLHINIYTTEPCYIGIVQIHIIQVILLFDFFFFFFLGLNLQHMEVPKLGVQSELQLPATAIAMQDSSCTCDLYHSSQRRYWILNPLRGGRGEVTDQTCILMDASRVLTAELKQELNICIYLYRHTHTHTCSV